MTKSISLEVTHPDRAPGLIEGFRFIWAYYVNGFNAETHCQPCFKGRRVDDFRTGTASSGRPVELDEIERYKYVYVCGVGIGPDNERRTQNFHLPLRYEEGGLVTKTTYNGYIVTGRNAVELPIPALPDGWKNRDRKTTRCKNFQFAVEYFGYPTELVIAERQSSTRAKPCVGAGADPRTP